MLDFNEFSSPDELERMRKDLELKRATLQQEEWIDTIKAIRLKLLGIGIQTTSGYLDLISPGDPLEHILGIDKIIFGKNGLLKEMSQANFNFLSDQSWELLNFENSKTFFLEQLGSVVALCERSDNLQISDGDRQKLIAIKNKIIFLEQTIEPQPLALLPDLRAA